MTPSFPPSRRPHRWLALATLAMVVACSDPTSSATSVDLANPALAKGAAGRVNTGALQVNVSGVPSGSTPSIMIAGPNGYSRQISTTTTITALTNGSYTLTAATFMVNGASYAASPSSRTVNVSKNSTTTVFFGYSVVVTTGTLAVTVSMPDATPAAVTVTGPNGYSTALSASASLAQLAAGSYVVAAAPVTSQVGALLAPTPTSQTLNVTAGTSVGATVSYAATNVTPTPGLNLQILGMYITQSIQTMNGGVPLVSGRDGVLRVFALANASNSVRPSVRARFFQNGTLVSTLTALAPTAAVPTSLNEASATASWNFVIPGTLLQSGVTVLADVDPDNTVGEDIESDNQFPVSGAPRALDVRFVPALAVRLVPVQQGNGLLGSVSDQVAFLARTRDMHPLSAVSSSVRTPYTSTLNLSSDGTNWSPLLSELRALRTSDGSTQNYYGVARVTYSSGVAGIGYIGAPASMGWDYLPSASEVMAHELGHNWGRQHAPCGGVGGPDANYPYAGGVIGVFGFNVRLNQLLSSATPDLMGYCNPTWISDYTYTNVMNFRGTSAAATTVTSASVQPSLLVWGRVEADGQIVLEPAVRMSGRSVLPAGPGDYVIEAEDASGDPLFSLSFTPDRVADETRAQGDQHFAFMIPMSDAAHARLASLAVRGNGRSAVRSARAAQASLDQAAASAVVESNGAGRARLRWNADAHPMAVLRDATTGDVLSFARGGVADIATSKSDVEVIFSDGVRSAARVVRVRGR